MLKLETFSSVEAEVINIQKEYTFIFLAPPKKLHTIFAPFFWKRVETVKEP